MQWNGVAATALAVTVERALESKRKDRLIDDPYAEAFIRAADAELPDSSTNDYFGVRSAYFDEWLRESWLRGARQTVILGAGLDMRAFRLDRPAGFQVFEIDQPEVVHFKAKVLRDLGISALDGHHSLALDLSDEWADALVASGFDLALPTAWLAEGLLLYLPADVERRLLTTISQLSRTGSRLAIESISGPLSQVANGEVPHCSRKLDLDMATLFNTEERPDPAKWLADHGWSARQELATQVAERFGRTLLKTPAEGRMITAVRDDGRPTASPSPTENGRPGAC